MTNQRALSLSDRFQKQISDAEKEKHENIEAAKKERVDEAERVIKELLAKEEEEHTSRPSRSLQNVENDGKSSIARMQLGRMKAGRREPTPLPTPPSSPIADLASVVFDNNSMAEIPGSQEIENIRISLHNHEAEIASLRLELEDTKAEVRDLHEQYRKASQEFAKATCEDTEENVQKSAKKRENLLKQLEQSNNTIKELQDEILQRKEDEGKLREELAEAEGRLKKRETILTEKDESVHKSSSSGNKRTKRKESRNWEFRRKKGEKTTPLTAGLEILSRTL